MAVERAPPLPVGAGMVQPVTEEERDAVRLFLSWVAEVVRIADVNADRVEAGQDGC